MHLYHTYKSRDQNSCYLQSGNVNVWKNITTGYNISEGRKAKKKKQANKLYMTHLNENKYA